MENTQEFSLDDLIAERRIEEGETFPIEVQGKTRKLVFVAKKVRDIQEYFDLNARTDMLLKSANSDTPPKEWEPFLPISREKMKMCVYASKLIVSPAISLLKAISMASDCGTMLAEISAPLISQSPAAEEVEEQEIDAEGNG